MISYLVDADGNRTHAVVPIHEWENMEGKDSLSMLDFMTYPQQHVMNTISFLKTLENSSVDDWKKAYDNYFDYYNKLDMIDFMVLYLFRSGILGTQFDEDTENNMQADDTSLFDATSISRHQIEVVKKDGSPFDWGAYKSIRRKIGISSEQEFLIYFHETLKFKETSIENFKGRYTRLHRNSEKDRLFIYDLNVLYGQHLVSIEGHYGKSLVTQLEHSFIEPFDIGKYLAKYLYNGNVSQVYRATKEAHERVGFFK